MIRFALEHPLQAGSADALFAGKIDGDARRAQGVEDGLTCLDAQGQAGAPGDEFESVAGRIAFA